MARKGTSKITFISAGAGSGKTHRLTELLHQELNSGGVRPSGVIATTFTKKAATELRERVRGHLLKQGNFQLANAMGQARIGTVNSICGQLISRFAFEAGLSTDQQVLEEVQAGNVLGKAIDSVLDGAEMSDLLTTARRLGLEEEWKSDLSKLLDQIRSNDISYGLIPLFAKRNADDLLSYFPYPTPAGLDQELLAAIQTALPTIESVAQAGGKKNTNGYLDLIRTFAGNLQNLSVSWGDWVKLSKELPEKSLHKAIEPIAELAGRFAEHGRLHGDIRNYLLKMFLLANKALRSYQEIKQELGALDFVDQEHQLLRLLDNESVAAVLKDELDLLMVDEFQDTSPIQLALFLKLASFAKRVYWVGDIKQAIYGFRGSDTELMRSILKALPALGGTKEILPSSWRSRPELVEIVNAAFSNAFSGSLSKEEVELTPTRKDVLSGPCLANWILGGKNASQDASALAAGIRRLVDSGYIIYDKSADASRPVRYGDVAILSRFNDGVKNLAEALSAQGIPVATSQPGLLATPEATLALACLRRLNDAGDTIATAEIVSLADGLEPETWVTDRLKYLQKDTDDDLWLEKPFEGHPAHPILGTIAELRTALPVLAPREALETVIAACQLSERVIRWSPDPDHARIRLANLEALLDLCSQYEDLCRSGQHAASISGLLVWLSEITGKEMDMLAEPAIDAVKVLTHHSAKGLEWPVVVLTDLAAAIRDRFWGISAQSQSDFDGTNPLQDRSIRYWPWPFGAQKSFAFADQISSTQIALSYRNSSVEENKRLLYVSMTRARDLLVLGRPSRKLTGEWIDCLQAHWLLPQAGADSITLPSGKKINADYWDLAPADEAEAIPATGSSALYWFNTAGARSKKLPLSFNPSSAPEQPASVLQQCKIGERIPIAAGEEANVLGTAIHDCLALSFTDQSVPLTEAEIDAILAGYQVQDSLPAKAVLRQVKAFHAWLEERWPGAKPLPEIAIQSLLESGQVLNGRIDLILETPEGWILLDHKSSQLAPDHWDQLATEYGAQIAAYAKAIEKSTSRKVSESWIFLPVAGGALQIGIS